MQPQFGVRHLIGWWELDSSGTKVDSETILCSFCGGSFSSESIHRSASGAAICEECLAQNSQIFDEASEKAVLRREDPEMAAVLQGELERQRNTIELIASENHTSRAVLAAQGSVATNKYAEGLPHARYYGGCEYVDQIEEIAHSRTGCSRREPEDLMFFTA